MCHAMNGCRHPTDSRISGLNDIASEDIASGQDRLPLPAGWLIECTSRIAFR